VQPEAVWKVDFPGEALRLLREARQEVAAPIRALDPKIDIAPDITDGIFTRGKNSQLLGSRHAHLSGGPSRLHG